MAGNFRTRPAAPAFRKLPARDTSATRELKTFDALTFLCAYIMASRARLLALLRTVMRHAHTQIAETAALIRPLGRLADWSCVSAMTWRPNFQLDTGLIRKARV
jgi:hypothetical protein